MLVRFVLELFSYRNDPFSAGVFVQGKQGPLLHEFDEDDLVNKAVCNKYILNTANESITGSIGFCQNEKETKRAMDSFHTQQCFMCGSLETFLSSLLKVVDKCIPDPAQIAV